MIAIDTPVRILVLALEPKGPSTHDRGIENESFNTMKNHGYRLEHDFGHGSQNLSAVLTTLNPLAFACHTIRALAIRALAIRALAIRALAIRALAIPLWRAATEAIGTRKRFFEHMRSITVFLVFPDWEDILATLAFIKPPPLPSR
jgi:hypothetical protein